MNIREQPLHIDDIPTLLVFPHDPREAAAHGTILHYHGLFSRKEEGKKELYSLAKQGYLAIGIDNVGHGERVESEENFPGNPEANYLAKVTETIQEIPGLVSRLVELGLAKPNQIGICGISMGGFIAFGSVLVEPRIKVCAPILGSPHWKHSLSPHRYPERFSTISLLAQNAARDESVPPHYARDFMVRLKKNFSRHATRLQYREFPKSGHFMDEGEWDELWENVLNWFQKYL